MQGQQFDIVYTSYGVVNWLPDLIQWGQVISQMLKDGGKFVIVEFHPVLWMFDENFSQVRYAYSRKEPYIVEEATYTDSETNNRQKTVTWNYGLAEVLMACSVTACRYSLLESMIIRPSTYLEI